MKKVAGEGMGLRTASPAEVVRGGSKILGARTGAVWVWGEGAGESESTPAPALGPANERVVASGEEDPRPVGNHTARSCHLCYG